VLDGDPAVLPKKGRSPQIFGPCLLWPNGWMDEDGTWRRCIGLSSGHLCERGTQHPSQKAGRAPPRFSCNFYCAQTAGSMTMPLAMEVGLIPGDFVFDGTQPSRPKKGTEPLPNFRPMSIMAKRLDGSRWHLAWWWDFVHATLC